MIDRKTVILKVIIGCRIIINKFNFTKFQYTRLKNLYSGILYLKLANKSLKNICKNPNLSMGKQILIREKTNMILILIKSDIQIYSL